jgi:hypothetical protein
MEEWPWVGVVNFWFFKRPSDAEKDQSWYYFRMVEPDFTALPVYDAMREYTAGLEPALYPGYHQEYHWALTYKGEWASQRASESASQQLATEGCTESVLSDYRWTSEPGATVSFAYEGATLTLVPGPDSGEIDLSVDGGAPRRISLSGEPVQLVGGLGRTRHEIVLTAVSGEVGIDGFIVQQPWIPSPWFVASTISLLIVGVGFIVRIVRRR